MRKISVLLAVLMLTAGLSGCVERANPNTSPAATTMVSTQPLAGTTVPGTSAATQAAAFPAQLMDLEIQDEAGTKLDLKEQAMGKPSIMIFWASW